MNMKRLLKKYAPKKLKTLKKPKKFVPLSKRFYNNPIVPYNFVIEIVILGLINIIPFIVSISYMALVFQVFIAIVLILIVRATSEAERHYISLMLKENHEYRNNSIQSHHNHYNYPSLYQDAWQRAVAGDSLSHQVIMGGGGGRSLAREAMNDSIRELHRNMDHNRYHRMANELRLMHERMNSQIAIPREFLSNIPSDPNTPIVTATQRHSNLSTSEMPSVNSNEISFTVTKNREPPKEKVEEEKVEVKEEIVIKETNNAFDGIRL